MSDIPCLSDGGLQRSDLDSIARSLWCTLAAVRHSDCRRRGRRWRRFSTASPRCPGSKWSTSIASITASIHMADRPCLARSGSDSTAIHFGAAAASSSRFIADPVRTMQAASCKLQARPRSGSQAYRQPHKNLRWRTAAGRRPAKAEHRGAAIPWVPTPCTNAISHDR